MSKNTEIWDKLRRVPPEHLKAFTRGGGFRGTAIKPMWTFHKMTEQFGPCGTGWGVEEPKFTIQPAGNEILVYCVATVWYDQDRKAMEPYRKVIGVGGDKILTVNSSGPRTDDEAFKKAFTDAVTNALKMIGAGADIHMGLWDGNKYVDDKPSPTASKNLANAHDEPDNRGPGEPFNDIEGVRGRPRFRGNTVGGVPNQAPEEFLLITSAIRAQRTVEDLLEWGDDPTNKEAIAKLPSQWIPHIRNEFKDRLHALKDVAA